MIASRPMPLNQSQKQTALGPKVSASQGKTAIASSNKNSALPPKNVVPARKDEMIEMSSSDDSEAESVNRKRSAEEKDDKDNNEPVEQLLKTKKARSKPFSEDLLVSPNGLEKIYFEFPLYCKYSSVRHGTTATAEGDFLKRLLTGYKEWAFQLHPGVSFTDAVGKCEVLGSRSRVRNYMMKMRDKERDRYMNDVLLPIARKQAEFVDFETRKAKMLEEQKRKEAEKTAAVAAVEQRSQAYLEEFTPLSPNTGSNRMNEEEDDEWDVFDEKLQRKPITLEVPTQIDEISDELLLSIENEAFVTQDINHSTTQAEQNIQEDLGSLQGEKLIEEEKPLTHQKQQEEKEDVEEDIFGEDSDDDIAFNRKPIPQTESQINCTDPQTTISEEVETYPQNEFL